MKNLKMMLVAMMLLLSTQIFAQNPQKEWNPEQRAKRQTERLKEKLNLSQEQSEKIFEINKARAAKMQAARKNNEVKAENRGLYRQKQNKELDAEYKNILTREQWIKWEEMKKEQENRSGRERKGKMKERKKQSQS